MNIIDMLLTYSYMTCPNGHTTCM